MLDASDSMAGEPLRELVRDLRLLIEELNLDFYTGTKVAIVVHSGGKAETLCRLANDRLAVVGCLGRVEASGAASHSAGLREAREVMARAREPEAWTPPRQAIVMFSGPTLDSGCGDALREAEAIQGDGVLLMTACAADECATSCVRRLATSPRYAFERIDDRSLVAVLNMVQNEDRWLLIKRLALDLHLSDEVVGIDGSAMPMPVLEDEASGHVRWSTTFVPREGVTFNVKVRPQRVGPVRTVSTATLAFSDTLDHGDVLQLDLPPVTVLDPRGLPTSTPPAMPSRPPEASPTTAGQQHAPSPIWLPILGREGKGGDARRESPRNAESVLGVQAAASPTHCVSVTYIDQDARVLLLGEAATLTVHVNALCAGVRRHVETIFVVDRSGAVSWPKQTDPAEMLAQALPWGNGDGGWPMGVVFHGKGRVLGRCAFGLSGDDWLTCLSGAQHGGKPNWSEALDQARQMLESALDPDLVPLGLQNVRFILLAGGPLGANSCESAQPALERIRQHGSRVETSCTRPGCERGCLSSLASADRAARGLVDVAELRDLMTLPRHYGSVGPIQLALDVALDVPADVRVSAITATRRVRIERSPREVRAFHDSAPREGITLTLRLSPLAAGQHRLVEGVMVTVEDEYGGSFVGGPSSEARWRPPSVLVLEPRVLPDTVEPRRLYLPRVTAP